MSEDDASDYESCLEEGSMDGQETESMPKGVAGRLEGAYLERCPDVPINIPVTQLMPVHTSDSLIEEETLLSALHDSPEDRERASREQAKVLLSDMAAFKAANPEAQLGDFVKWHSPKDWVRSENGEGCLSQRMSHESNKWMKLWEEVRPQAASEQLPLFDPAMAGERALYFLETIEPVELFWQLFRVGLVAVFDCLSRSRAATFDRIRSECNAFVKFLKESLDHVEYQTELATELIEKFKDVERNVVLGEALLRHLPDCESTARLLFDRVLSNASITSQGINVPEADKERILSLLLSTNEDQKESSANAVLRGTVLTHEWVITCRKKGFDGDQEHFYHRLYFKDAVNEVRLGTVLISDM